MGLAVWGKWMALRKMVASHPDNHLMTVNSNRQKLCLLIGGVLAFSSVATLVRAQSETPPATGDQVVADEAPAQAPKIDKWNDAHSIPRNRQFSVSWPKLLSFWLLFLVSQIKNFTSWFPK